MKKIITYLGIILCLICVSCGQEEVVADIPYSLQNCEGDMVSPYDWEGQVQVVRLFVVAGWCVACSASIESIYQTDVDSEEFAQMIILIADKYDEPVSSEYCFS